MKKGGQMNIDSLTIGEVKQLMAMLGGNQIAPTAGSVTGHWQIGKNYLLLMAGTFYVGRLVAVDQYELVLEDAAWVADTGRFAEALATGVVSEVEPCTDGQALLGRGAMVAAFLWGHDLLRVTK